MRAPTGEQFELSASFGGRSSCAIITEVAAGLRRFDVDGMAVVDGFSAEAAPPFANGIVLAPWPNRVRDGVWQLHGVRQQLDITEVDKHNAIHGLLRTTPYRVVNREGHRIELSATLYPQHGYPFLVDTFVSYELVQDGLLVTHSFTNLSARAAPVAVGTHPFLRVGDTPIAELTLTLQAGTRFVTDDRLNPVVQEAVDGTAFDLRSPVLVGSLHLDDAFTAEPDASGISRHRLTAPDGRFTELWQGPDFGYVQAFTPHVYPRPTEADSHATGLAVAIEPMTAPPNAFNSGIGLIWLPPSASWSGSWGVTHGEG